MVNDGIVIKEQIKKIEKNLSQLNKKIAETSDVLDKLKQDYANVVSMKSNTEISKSYLNEAKTQINKTDILANAETTNKLIDGFAKSVLDVQNKLIYMSNFLENFRTQRTYKIKDEKKIFRFLSGFLEGFSEVYYFKPEFIGIVNLNELATAVKGTKDGPLIKIAYEQIPTLINYAYAKQLKNFVLESHNLKMVFNKDFVVKISADNEMIKKIDRIAKECSIEQVN